MGTFTAVASQTAELWTYTAKQSQDQYDPVTVFIRRLLQKFFKSEIFLF